MDTYDHIDVVLGRQLGIPNMKELLQYLSLINDGNGSHVNYLPPGAHPGFSQGGSNFFPCIVASRVRKINFT